MTDPSNRPSSPQFPNQPGVYFCPPTPKFEELEDPPEGETSAVSYAGQDTDGSPMFWMYKDGKWDEHQVLFVQAINRPRRATDTLHVRRELLVSFLDCVIEQWPEILERYQQRTDVPEFIRAAGDCLCKICQQPYWKHEYDKRYPTPPSMWLRINRPEYFLHKLCDGTLVKL